MKKFEFLLHLLNIGVKPKHAVRMAKQVPKESRVIYLTPACAVSAAFAWDDTEEGSDYWLKVHDIYEGFDGH